MGCSGEETEGEYSTAAPSECPGCHRELPTSSSPSFPEKKTRSFQRNSLIHVSTCSLYLLNCLLAVINRSVCDVNRHLCLSAAFKRRILNLDEALHHIQGSPHLFTQQSQFLASGSTISRYDIIAMAMYYWLQIHNIL